MSDDAYSADEQKFQRILDDLDNSSPECLAACDALTIIRISRERDAVREEREEDRKALERLHHEIGIDLPDEGMTILQLVGNLLAAAHERDSTEITSVRDTASAMLSALAAERNEAMIILDPSGETQSLVDAAKEIRARADASVTLAKDLAAVTDERDAALATLAKIAGKTPGKFPAGTGPGLAIAHERAAARLLDALAILAENPDWKPAKDRVDQCEAEVARLEVQRRPPKSEETACASCGKRGTWAISGKADPLCPSCIEWR